MTDRESHPETVVDIDVSDRVNRVEPSASLAIGSLAATLKREGADVVDLSRGDPDFDTPQPIVAAAKRALDAGHTHYTQAAGIPTFREAIATTLQADGLEYSPDSQSEVRVLHTIGAANNTLLASHEHTEGRSASVRSATNSTTVPPMNMPRDAPSS